MRWEDIHNVYLIGIGGIGMSALARYFNGEGKRVSGYDRTRTDLTNLLEKEGIGVSYEDDITGIEPIFRNKENTLVIYTPAVPESHSGLTYFRGENFTVMKRAEVLGLISKNTYCIAIAGTHGKTTTSSITAHILKHSGMNVTAFLGGIAVNYHSNYISSPKTDYMVVEADEFDRSFLHLEPTVSVITSVDADHLDIYGKEEEVKESFIAFTNRLKPEGKLFIRQGLELEIENVSADTYAAEGDADFSVNQLMVTDGRFEFDVLRKKNALGHFSSAMPGMHNVENTLAAIAVANHLGVDAGKIKDAVKSFKGVKRRFERIAETSQCTYIDDYAHHPEEIKACIRAARDLFPGKRITGIFQPHLFSRTRDFVDGFAESLSALDALLLMEIYPAREEPVPGVTSSMLLEKISMENKTLVTKEDVLGNIEEQLKNTDVLLTMGAGDIDRLVEPIKKLIESN